MDSVDRPPPDPGLCRESRQGAELARSAGAARSRGVQPEAVECSPKPWSKDTFPTSGETPGPAGAVCGAPPMGSA